MRLSKFILANMEEILQEWEDFAGTLHSLVHAMNQHELRDHAEAMLRVIVVDLDTAQARQQSIEKSQGLAPELPVDTAAEVHAAERLAAGYTIEQLTAEYRALRASVLRLWLPKVASISADEMRDIMRFNEAIDQALTESIGRYSIMQRESQNLFLAILGHDVRSPLGAISMGAQLLLLDEALPAKSLRLATRILRSSKRVEEIVRDLLDFSTSHLGDGIPITPTALDFAAVCDNVVEEVRTVHAERRVTLALHGDLRVVWDGARIGQAFANLLINGIQHGSDSDEVAVVVTGSKDDIVWSVNNRGEPIPPPVLRTIFDPARRFALRPASERSPGQAHNLGLGLYIAREIISAHGGRIAIASSKADGTTFTVQIPRHARHVRPPRP